MTDEDFEDFKITLQVLQVLTPKFTATLFQLYVKDDFNVSLE